MATKFETGSVCVWVCAVMTYFRLEKEEKKQHQLKYSKHIFLHDERMIQYIFDTRTFTQRKKRSNENLIWKKI